jgi:DNA-binding MarR family transcriptional regulator
MSASTVQESPTLHSTTVGDAEMECWRQFFDSSTGLLSTLNKGLVDAHGLTLFDVLLLEFLARSEIGCARMRDMAAAFVLAPSRVTQHIRRLQSQGLVNRSPDPDDRRGMLTTITPNGRSRLGPALETYGRGIRAHYLNQMSRRQMIALGDSCQRIGTALKPE